MRSISNIKSIVVKTKLQAVTLTEVLVAMSLLGIVLTFTMLISERVYTESSQSYTVKAHAAFDATLSEIKKERIFLDFEKSTPLEEDELQVKAVFSKSSLASSLLELELAVYDEKTGTLIISEKHLINGEEGR